MSFFDELDGATPWDDDFKLPQGWFIARVSYATPEDREEQETRMGLRRERDAVE